VDVHLGRLAGYLRLCGFDTLYRNDWEDCALAETAVEQGRILLTRDRGLLKRAVITHGHLVRAMIPSAQLGEILDRFDLWDQVDPFGRCSVCNGPIVGVPKAEVLDRLPKRTARHFDEFWRCATCDRVYWQGAHYRSLCRLFRRESNVGGRESPARKEGDSD
jgi:uncharacterized protein with PIN domain